MIMSLHPTTASRQSRGTPSSDDVTAPRPVPLRAPAVGEAVSVCDGVWWGRIPLPAPADNVNVYLLRDEDGWVLVDAGCCSSPCRRALATMLRGLGLRFANISRVVVTHHHPDHLGIAAELQARGVGVVVTAECLETARRRYSGGSTRPSESDVALARRCGLLGVHLEAYRRRAPQRFPSPQPLVEHECRVVEHNESLEINGRTWRVMVGNGHAPGHLTLWSEDGLALTGDHFLLGMATNLAIDAGEPERDPVEAFESSSTEMLRLATDETLILPGHNQPYTGVAARWSQIGTSRASFIERLLAVVSQPRTALECLAAVHLRELQAYEKHLLLADCLGHLNHLRDRGVVEELPHGSGASLWRRVSAQTDGGFSNNNFS